MELIWSKVTAMIVLAVASFLLGLSAVSLRKVLGLTTSEPRRKQTIVTSILLCFGAGVLLATAMLHILPEVMEGLEKPASSLGVEWLPELVFCSGFFLIYLVEEAVHLYLHSTQHTEHLHRSLSLRRKSSHTPDTPDSTCAVPGTASSCCNNDGSDVHNDMEMQTGDGEVTTDSVPSTNYNPKYSVRLSLTTSSMFPNYQPPDSLPPTVAVQDKKKHSHTHFTPGSPQSSLLRDFFTVLALSFHAVFEGLVVGLEKDTPDVWAMFTAIATHKFVITFCVSLELLQAGVSTISFGLYLVTFSLVSSLGIGIGLGITQIATPESELHNVTVAVLQGLAGGTIMYVVMFEVLQREKGRDVPGILQLFGILLGFLTMLLIQLFAHEGHSHSHDTDDHDHHHDQYIGTTLDTSSLMQDDPTAPGSPLSSLQQTILRNLTGV